MRNEIKTLEVKEIAKALGTSPMKIKSAILNGTMPVGAVFNDGGRDRVVILQSRWEAWAEAMDLKGAKDVQG